MSDNPKASADDAPEATSEELKPDELNPDELEQISGGFGDIKGESTDKDHKDWVMITSFRTPAR